MNKTLNTQLDGRTLTVRFDHADKSVNTFSPEALAELEAVIASLEESAEVDAVIFTSGKPGVFVTGADLFALNELNDNEVDGFLKRGQELFDRIAALPMTTVAAINGTCLGGGMELALACDWRVAADLGSINLGLPEVKLGILPAWGGTTRVTQMLGPAQALPLLLAGSTMSPRKAQRRGLIDEVVRPEALMAAARRLTAKQPPRRRPSRRARAMAKPPLRSFIFNAARKQTLAKIYGNYPAAEAIIDVVGTVCRSGHDAGLQAERDAVSRLRAMDGGKNLMRLFFLRQSAKRAVTSELQATPHEVEHAAVIGGGAMGAGIVHALVRAGIPVRLIEVNADAAAAGLGRVKKMLDADLKAKKISPLEAEQALDLVSPTADWTGLGLADVVIEAVAENMDVKRAVFAKLDALTRPDAVLASNTSSLSLTEMAEATKNPGRVIGLHFFNPVNKMPLIEVIRTAHTDAGPLATGVALAMRIGKTPVLANDAPGFVVNRVLIPYLAEALRMAEEGASIEALDETMKRWGMPMGPFELLDQVGLDVSVHILRSLGGQLRSDYAVPASLEAAIERGEVGRKSGKGFYNYSHKKRTPLNDAITLASPDAKHATPDEDTTVWRLLAPMINEAARLLEEGVITSTDTLDLATVLGLGLAPFRGGLTHFVHTVGLDKVVRRADELAALHGTHLSLPDSLRRVASNEGTMQNLVPHARPETNGHGTATNGHATASNSSARPTA